MLRTFALLFFIVGVLIYGYSFHNADLAFNVQYGAIDQNFFGYRQDKINMHLNSLAGFEFSIIFMLVGFVMLFYSKEVVKK